MIVIIIVISSSSYFTTVGAATCGFSFSFLPAMEVFPTVAVTLDGVDPALEWLTSQLAVRLARDSYLPSITSVWAKAVHYPATFLKSSYLRVAGLLAGGEDHEASNGARGT